MHISGQTKITIVTHTTSHAFRVSASISVVVRHIKWWLRAQTLELDWLGSNPSSVTY